MTLATRCPRCATVFRLVPEQLLLAQGWARCGCCHAAFDAAAARFEFETPEPPAAAKLEPLVAPAADPPASFESWSEAAPDTPPAAPAGSFDAALAVDTRREPGFEAEPMPPAAATAGLEPNLEPDLESEPEPATAPADALATAPEPRFVRQARARERWSRPRTRQLLGLVALLLLLAMLLQSLYWGRGALAARWPLTRPALERLCAPLHCRVQAPIAPQQLVLEGSSLSPAGADTLLLQAQLHNKGRSAIAYPALELTVLGAPTQVLARRVLQPQDYLAGAQDSAALQRQLDLGLAAQGELSIALPLKTLGLSASGYTLFAFYP